MTAERGISIRPLARHASLLQCGHSVPQARARSRRAPVHAPLRLPGCLLLEPEPAACCGRFGWARIAALLKFGRVGPPAVVG